MSKIIEIEKNNVKLYKINFPEKKRRRLFINKFIAENFGEGKFYSKLKIYGVGSFSAGEY